MVRILSAEEVQRYIAQVRAGEGLTAAARRIGVDPKAVREARKMNPEFDEDVKMAETEAAEPVERELYTAAMNGEPWAVKLWLERRSSDRWGPVAQTINVNHGVSLAPGAEHILELAQRLALRKEMLGIDTEKILELSPSEVIEDTVVGGE